MPEQDSNPFMQYVGARGADAPPMPTNIDSLVPPVQEQNPFMQYVKQPEKKQNVWTETQPVAETITKLGRSGFLASVGLLPPSMAKELYDKTGLKDVVTLAQKWWALDREMERLQDSPEMKAEEARRRQDHMPTSGMDMQRWSYQQAHERIFGPEPPDKSVREYASELTKAAVEHPGLMAASFIEGAVLRPELFFGGPLGAVTVGGIESIISQEGESGKVSGNKLLFDTAMLAFPPTAAHATMGAVKLASKGVPRTELKMVESIAQRVKAGQSAEQALEEVLLTQSSATADEQAAIVKAAKPHIKLKSKDVMDASTVHEETPNAADQERPQDQKVDGEPLRKEEGDAGVLRQPEQGQDQGHPQEAANVDEPLQEQPNVDQQQLTKLGVNIRGMPLDELKSYTAMMTAQAKQGGEAGAKAKRYLEVLQAEMGRRKSGLSVVDEKPAEPPKAEEPAKPADADALAAKQSDATGFHDIWTQLREKLGQKKARELVIEGEEEVGPNNQKALNQWLKDQLPKLGIAGAAAIGYGLADPEDKNKFAAAGLVLEGAFYSPTAKHFLDPKGRVPWSKAGEMRPSEFIKYLDARVKDGRLPEAEIEYLNLRGIAKLLEERGETVSKPLLEAIFKNDGLEIKVTPYDHTNFSGKTPRWENYQLPGGYDPVEIVLSLPGHAVPMQFNEMHHYPDIPNKVAHFRGNTRIGADGARGFHVAEAQFDWAQQARDKGVMTPEQAKELAAADRRLRSIDAEITDIEKSLFEEKTRRNSALYRQMEDRRYDLIAEALELDDKLNNAPVPAGPMLKDNAARTLAWKAIIKYATEKGFDRITWDRGDQQLWRYGRNIEEMMAEAEGQGETETLNKLDEKYKRIERGMDSFYGDQHGKTATGEYGTWARDLQRVLRDVKAPAELRMFNMDLEYNNYFIAQREDYGGYSVMDSAGREIAYPFKTELDAESYLKDKFGLTPDVIGQQPGFNLTPELKSASLEPMSMFNQRGAVDPELLKWLTAGSAGALSATAMAYALSPQTEDRLFKIAAAGVGGAILAAALKPIARGGMDLYAGMSKRPVNPKDIFQDANAVNSVGNFVARQLRKQWEAAITPPMFQQPLERAKWEAGGKQKAWRNIRDYLQGHDDVELTDQQKAVAAHIRSFLSDYGDQLVKEKILTAEAVDKNRETYLTGLYRKPMGETWQTVIAKLAQFGAYGDDFKTGMFPKTRFSRSKVFPDYRTVERLHKEGKVNLEPATDNPFAIVEHYLKSTSKTRSVKQLIERLKQEPGPLSREIKSGPRVGEQRPIPLMVRHTTDAERGPIVGNVRRVQQQLGMSEEWGDHEIKSFIANAPKDYVTINHPALEGYKVYRDLKGPLELLFDVHEPTAVGRAIYATSLAAKGVFFAMSMFHPGTLGVVATALGLPRGISPAELARFPRYWLRDIPEANKALKGMGPLAPEARRAIGAGMTVHTPDDVLGYGFIDDFLGFMEKSARGSDSAAAWRQNMGKLLAAPPLAVKTVNRWFQHMLWDQIQPTLKLATYFSELQKSIEKNTRDNLKDPKKHPLRDVDEMRREVAKGANDLYGGQNHFNLANSVDGRMMRSLAMSLESPYGRRMQQILLISPDWNISATRAWYEGIKTAIPGITKKASDSMYRGYLLWSAAAYLASAEYVYQHFNNDPTHHFWEVDNPNGAWGIPLGDGRYINLNKHFMETIHAINDPAKFIINKMNYLPKETMEQLFSKEFLTPSGGPAMQDKSMTGRLGHALSNLSPIVAKSYMQSEENRRLWMFNYFGFPISGLTDQELADKTAVRAVENAAKKAEAKYPGDEFQKDTAISRAEFEADRIAERQRKRRERVREEAKDKADQSLSYKLRKRIQDSLE